MKFPKLKKKAAAEVSGIAEGLDNEPIVPAEPVSAQPDGAKKPKRQKKVRNSGFGKNRPGVTTDMFFEPPGVISFGKKKVALNLNWLPPHEDLKPPAQIREANQAYADDPSQRTIEFESYVGAERTGFIGAGTSELGHQPGMKALVTMISDEIAGPRWIGAFPIDPGHDKWWVAAFRDGKVFSDTIADSAHRAEEMFLEDLQAPDWTSVFAPAEWGMPDTRPDPLISILDFKKGEKLKSLTPVKDNLPRVMIAATAIGLIGGFYFYMENKRAEELRQLEEIRRALSDQVELGPTDRPWHELTHVDQFIASCMAQIDKAVKIIPGWENHPVTCTAQRGKGSISTGWKRVGGSFSWVRAAIDPGKPEPNLAPDGNVASWSMDFDLPVDKESWREVPWDGTLIDSRMRQRFQVFDINLAMRPNDKNQQAAKKLPVFNSHDMKISADYGVEKIGDILKDVPALVPRALVYNVKTGTFDLAMQAYHPPILPPLPSATKDAKN